MQDLTGEIAAFIDNVQLCFVATVNQDGSPNLSPKASLAVYDDRHLVFANMASPQTVDNLRRDPRIEINVVDIFLRHGYLFQGTATLMGEGTPEYGFVADPFWAKNGRNYPIHEIVKIEVTGISEIRSPAYTYGEGITEAVLSDAFHEFYGRAASGTTGD
jgi:uncharacterized protein